MTRIDRPVRTSLAVAYAKMHHLLGATTPKTDADTATMAGVSQPDPDARVRESKEQPAR